MAIYLFKELIQTMNVKFSLELNVILDWALSLCRENTPDFVVNVVFLQKLLEIKLETISFLNQVLPAHEHKYTMFFIPTC